MHRKWKPSASKDQQHQDPGDKQYYQLNLIKDGPSSSYSNTASFSNDVGAGNHYVPPEADASIKKQPEFYGSPPSTSADPRYQVVEPKKPKNYYAGLKTRPTTTVSYHVQAFAELYYSLSDEKHSEFCGVPCDELLQDPHSHDMKCDRCALFPEVMEDLFNTLDNVLKDAVGMDEEILNEVKDECKNSEKKIFDWKKHICRAVKSEKTRQKLLDNLQNNEAMVTLDYAMKFLPQKHNETQRDFYAKSGLSWHVSAIEARMEGKRVQHAVLHLLGKEDQNSNIVAAIIRDVQVRCEELGIKKVIYRMDNAGYYRNATLIQSCMSISRETNAEIAGISFSEVQAGKSLSDRIGGQAKARIKEAKDAGNDVETADDMFTGLTYGPKPIPAVTVAVAEVIDKFSENDFKIPGISQISDVIFDYETNSCVVRRHHGIGPGKVVKITNTLSKPKLQIVKETPYKPDTENFVFWREPGSLLKTNSKKTKAQNKNSSAPTAQTEDSEDESSNQIIEEPENYSFNPFKLYSCPTENCIKKFSNFGNFQNHCANGKHTFVPQRMTLYDTAINLFAAKLEHLEEERMEILGRQSVENFGSNDGKMMAKGWALNETAAKKRFPAEVHVFIEQQMAKYKQQGRKVDAKVVENLMETATNPETGRKLFAPSERLDSNQIASLVKRKIEKELKIARNQTNDPTDETMREEINDELENETGDIGIEFQDDPMFPDDMDVLNDHNFDDIVAEEEEHEQVKQPPTTKRTSRSDSSNSQRRGRKRKQQN